MTDPRTLPYRPCAGLMILNAEGKVFVGQRIDTEVEAWQMPQGGIDDGEDPETEPCASCARRPGSPRTRST